MLSDFGVAKMLEIDETLDLTGTQVGVGTPWYMAPEQGSGKPTDHRTDIYALGVVFYELITGRKPYQADTPMAVVVQHINDPLPPPRHVKPDLPEAMERLILKAMAKSPDDRFQRTEEMVEALQQTVAGLPVAFDLPRPPDASVEPTVPDRTVRAVTTPSRESVPEKVTTAPTPRSVPWLPIAGAVALLAVGIDSRDVRRRSRLRLARWPPAQVAPAAACGGYLGRGDCVDGSRPGCVVDRMAVLQEPGCARTDL